MEDWQTTWYIIVRLDNHYPLQIYADKLIAETVAKANKEKVIKVEVSKLNKPYIPI
jgi:hypothetical protein